MNIQSRHIFRQAHFSSSFRRLVVFLFTKDSEVIKLYFRNKILDFMNMINFSKAERKILNN